jgi:hypothetical protein
MLRDDDAALGDEAAGSGPGGFHEGFPVAACGVGFVTWVAGDEFGGFRWTDGFGSVAVGFALSEELEDGGFEGGVLFSGAVAAAGRGTEFEDVPVAGVLFGPVEGALARLAEFFFVGVGRSGLGFRSGIVEERSLNAEPEMSLEQEMTLPLCPGTRNVAASPEWLESP